MAKLIIIYNFHCTYGICLCWEHKIRASSLKNSTHKIIGRGNIFSVCNLFWGFYDGGFLGFYKKKIKNWIWSHLLALWSFEDLFISCVLVRYKQGYCYEFLERGFSIFCIKGNILEEFLGFAPSNSTHCIVTMTNDAYQVRIIGS